MINAMARLTANKQHVVQIQVPDKCPIIEQTRCLPISGALLEVHTTTLAM
jgi:hypothetical protein